MKPKFMSSADSNKKLAIYTESDNTEILIDKDTDEMIQELFDLLLHRYQTILVQSMKGRHFVFDYVHESY